MSDYCFFNARIIIIIKFLTNKKCTNSIKLKLKKKEKNIQLLCLRLPFANWMQQYPAEEVRYLAPDRRFEMSSLLELLIITEK